MKPFVFRDTEDELYWQIMIDNEQLNSAGISAAVLCDKLNASDIQAKVYGFTKYDSFETGSCNQGEARKFTTVIIGIKTNEVFSDMYAQCLLHNLNSILLEQYKNH